MAAIYSRCTRVFIWLGPASSDSEYAFRLMATITEQYDKGDVEAADTLWLMRLINNGSHSAGWKAINSLFGRTWWTRAWVIQEAVAAPDSIIVCGKRQMTLRELYAAGACISSSWNQVNSTLRAKEGMSLDPTGFNTIDCIYLLREKRIGGYTPDLLSCLYITNDSEASTKHDFIYSKLALASDVDDLDLHPIYDKSADQMFISFVETHIVAKSSLDILTIIPCFSRHSDFTLPSWVPDFSGHNYTRHLQAPLRNYSHKEDKFDVIFTASGSTKPDVFFDGDEIHVQGALIFDEIDGVGHCDLAGITSSEIAQPESTKNIYGAQKGFDAIWRTMCLDVMDSGYKSAKANDSFGKRLASIFHAFGEPQYGTKTKQHNSLANWYLNQKDFRFGDKTVQEWVSRAVRGEEAFTGGLEDVDEVIPSRERVEDDILRNAEFRVLVTTSRGYFGQTHHDVQKNDKVCVLKGCSLPLIIRKDEDSGCYKVRSFHSFVI
jgi:hypothetical protein